MKREIVFSADAGLLYEDRYGGWIATLKEAVEAPEGARYVNPPWSWVPFLLYHGVEVQTPQVFHPTDVLMTDAHGLWEKARATGQERELVEMASTLRPELSDCLWQADCVWRIRWRNHTHRSGNQVFITTNNGSFHRPEVLSYLENLRRWEATLPGCELCVVVPCAADKPYPAPIHKAVRKVIPAECRMLIATGVFGIVAEQFWAKMPHYDSGIPYRWRVMTRTKEHFSLVEYGKVVVYSDFYADAVRLGLTDIGQAHKARFPVAEAGAHTLGEAGYADLLSEPLLAALKEAFQ